MKCFFSSSGESATIGVFGEKSTLMLAGSPTIWPPAFPTVGPRPSGLRGAGEFKKAANAEPIL